MLVQFENEDELRIVATFNCPQDPEIYPYQGSAENDDPRYLAFIAPAVSETITDPIEKLKAFLLENPDVAEILK